MELGPESPRARALAERAAAPLEVAGRRAFGRGDMPAAVRLLARAAELHPAGEVERLRVLPELAFALMETGDFGRLQEVVAELDQGSGAEVGLAGHAAVLRLWMRLFTDPVGWIDVVQEEADRAVTSFRGVGDERGLARVASLLGVVELNLCRFGDAERHWTEASEHARSAGDHRDELDSLAWVPLAVWAGATPVDQGLLRCREIRARVDGDKKAMASADMAAAGFDAGAGRFDEARTSLRRAQDLLTDVALVVWLAGPYAQLAGWVELLAGNPAAAEAVLRPGYEDLRRMGEMSWFSTTAGILAHAVVELDRPGEAAGIADVAREAAAPHDVYSQVLWRTAAARAAVPDGRGDEAVRLVDEAADLVAPTDFLHLRWHTHLTRARVLAGLGRTDEARDAARLAAEAATAKGAAVPMAKAAEVVATASP
jgi:tetratricopeptide (TPR) repeat protein